jgi:hypothetical protein
MMVVAGLAGIVWWCSGIEWGWVQIWWERIKRRLK